MFNFFDEIKSKIGDLKTSCEYNLVNISGRIVYIEGHKGLIKLSTEEICIATKRGSISVFGSGLILQELYEDCVKISGKIKKIEVFDAKN